MKRLLGFGLCLLVVLGCGDDMVILPAQIDVTNSGETTAVISIVVSGSDSVMTLEPGASGSVTSMLGGGYTLTVILPAEEAQRYKDLLIALKRSVEKALSGEITTQEQQQLLSDLARIKSSIASMTRTDVAGCAGNAKVGSSVRASAGFTGSGGAGFWSVICGSSE